MQISRKRKALAGLTIMCSIGILAGCGADYSVEEDTVFVLKNGKIISTDVEAFDETSYHTEGLKSFIKEAIGEYTSENGSDSVKLKEVTVENGKAVLTIEYASAEDYANFNEIAFFTGSVQETLAAGYMFEDEFAQIDGENISECDKELFLDKEGVKVVVIEGEKNVNVSGRILYASTDHTKLLDAKTLEIRQDNNLLSSPENATELPEGTEAVQQTIDGTEVPESAGSGTGTTEASDAESESSGSVDTDEFDLGTEEEETVTFEFGDDARMQAYEMEGYTYLIYK